MAFVDVAIAVGGAVGLEGGAAILGGGAIIGAGTGAAYSAITGDGNILNSALTGGLIGGAGAYGLGAMGAGSAATQAAMAGPFWGGAATPALSTAASSNTPALVAAAQTPEALQAQYVAQDIENGLNAGTGLASTNTAGSSLGTLTNPATTGLTGGQILGYGLAGSAALSLLGNMNTPRLSSSSTPGQNPSYIRPYTYAANPTNTGYNKNVNGLGSSAEQRYFNPTMTAQPIYKAAEGGLTPPPNVDFMGNGAYPMSQQETPHYATPSQMPTSAQQVKASYEPDTNPLTGEPISMAKGGKAEDDETFNFNDLPKAKKELLLDLMASPMTMPKMPGSDVGAQNAFEKYQMSQMPQGAYGRVSATKILDDDSSLRAGLSGVAMAQPNKHGVTTMPGNIDVGYNKRFGDGNVDLSAFRSINPMPGRGHAQGLNARYTLPFAEGGAVTIHNVDPQIWNQVDNLVSKVASAPPAAPYQAMSSNPAVQAYNDMIMQKAAQTYVNPQGTAPAPMPFADLTRMFPQEQPQAPQGYTPPAVPSNFDPTLVSQWQSANPQVRSYNAASQKYGSGIPNQNQYDGFKAQKEQEAADALAAQQFQPFSYDGGGGGGAAGGLPQDFAYANGGHLGSYSDGGRMLKGPGDGMSDNIPASIGGKQPARLADGEFVVPADVVSHLGNGSTDAGAKRLYAMMDNVRKARTGTKKQGKQIKAEKYLPT
jgi:hypothetical protein